MKKTEVKLTKEQKKLKAKLEYGDIGNLCRVLEVSRMTFWKTLNGRRKSPYIWDAIRRLTEQRDAKRARNITHLTP
ncbi:hypothetical protein [Aureispira anguillae]|nr:hypothetical protein [Aureispira anguillae]